MAEWHTASGQTTLGPPAPETPRSNQDPGKPPPPKKSSSGGFFSYEFLASRKKVFLFSVCLLVYHFSDRFGCEKDGL